MKNIGGFLLISLISVFIINGIVMGITLGDLNDDMNFDAAQFNRDSDVNSKYNLLRKHLSGVKNVFSGSSNARNKGFYVENGSIYDANGNIFIMRGINHAHTWYKGYLDTALYGIANTNANTVRIVLSNGGQWTKDSMSSLQEIIEKCKQHKLVVMLEIHDCIGYGDTQYAPNAVHISTAVDYWIEMKNALIGQEEYVIINIANEPFGNDVSSDTYINDHITAIQRLRNNGFKHALVIDGDNWGQDWENTMRNRAFEIFNADPEKNIIFSVHMYQVYQDDFTINNYMQTFINNNLPLIVGEFGADHHGEEVDEVSIMRRAEEYGLGYIGWSWKGNSSDVASLDIAVDWAGNTLSNWGEILVNSSNGLKKTAKTCTIFTDYTK